MKLFAILLALVGAEKPWLKPVPREQARVVAVDGDTIAVPLCPPENVVDDALCEWRLVRLLGIQAPETGYFKEIGGKRVWVDDPAPCAMEARDRMAALVEAMGAQIRLKRDGPDFDATEKRWLRRVEVCRVHLAGCLDAAERLIAEGLAREFTYQGQAYARQAEYRMAENEARKKNLGLWGKKGCG